MKVLQIYRDHFSLMPGGIERHVDDLARGLAGRVEMSVLASSRKRRRIESSEGGVRTLLMPEYARLGGISLGRGYVNEIRDLAPDVIHLHVPNPTGEIAFLRSKTSARLVVSYHADLHRSRWVRPAYHRFLSRLLERAEAILVSSRRLQDSSTVLDRLSDRSRKRSHVVPFGTDTGRFCPGPTEGSSQLRARWGSSHVVLYLGRLRHYKGIDVLIEAVAGTKSMLVVVGDGPERSAVLQLGRRVLGDRFIWAGEVTEDLLPDIYRAADVFCLPSTSSAETFGIATTEAMASGLPVITSEVGTATSEVNEDGRTGMVVRPGDVADLRGAILKLATDQRLAAQMASEARAVAVERFSRDRMLDQVLAVYDEVISA